MSGKPNTLDHREPHWPEGLYIRGRSYKYRRRVRGQKKPFIDTMGTIRLDEATRKAMRYNLDIADGRCPRKENAKRETTFEGFAVDVWLKKKAGTVAGKSFTRYRAVVDNFLDYLTSEKGMGDCLLSDIDYSVADDFRTHRRVTPIAPNGRKHLRKLKDGASKNTVYIEVSTLRQLFNEAVTRRLIEENPFAGVKAPKPKLREVAAKHHALTKAEERAILEAARTWDASNRAKGDVKFHDIVLLMVKTGLRSDELCHLEWTDIDWRKGVIVIQEKTVSETRMISIPDKAVPYIKRLASGKSSDEALFPGGDELMKRGVYLDIRKQEDLAKIQVGDMDWDDKVITTTRAYTWKPKGSAGDVPMCETVRELLKRLQARRCGNFVFEHHDGGRCRLKLLAILKEVQKMAGIEGRLRIHDLRHTTAVRLREKGTPLETIMGIMRHADIRETLIYAPYDLTEGQKAILALDD